MRCTLFAGSLGRHGSTGEATDNFKAPYPFSQRKCALYRPAGAVRDHDHDLMLNCSPIVANC